MTDVKWWEERVRLILAVSAIALVGLFVGARAWMVQTPQPVAGGIAP